MFSQQELANRAGVSLFTIQRIERGEGSVRPRTGRAVATALGVGVEDLLPKAQAPSSSEPTLWNGMLEEEKRRYLLALLGTWTAHMSELSDYYGPRLENLPEHPPLEEITRYQWVVDCFNTCLLVEQRIDADDFAETVGPWVDRVDAGDQVPPDIHQKVRAFQDAWTRWVVVVASGALDWIRRQRERIGEASADFSAELDRLDSEQELSTPRWAESTAWTKSAE